VATTTGEVRGRYLHSYTYTEWLGGELMSLRRASR
jgi:hypothetical protein